MNWWQQASSWGALQLAARDLLHTPFQRHGLCLPVVEHWLEQEITHEKSIAQRVKRSSVVRAFVHGSVGRRIDPS